MKQLSSLQKRLINFWVGMRTDFRYLMGFIVFCLVWVFCNKTTFIVPAQYHWDNLDLTYLNLLLSILAEVSSITILIYTLRLSDRHDDDIEEIKTLLSKDKPKRGRNKPKC